MFCMLLHKQQVSRKTNSHSEHTIPLAIFFPLNCLPVDSISKVLFNDYSLYHNHTIYTNCCPYWSYLYDCPYRSYYYGIHIILELLLALFHMVQFRLVKNFINQAYIISSENDPSVYANTANIPTIPFCTVINIRTISVYLPEVVDRHSSFDLLYIYIHITLYYWYTYDVATNFTTPNYVKKTCFIHRNKSTVKQKYRFITRLTYLQ
ncbi:hypothetical protein QTP88_022756 [Uroleucon formosanum]